MENGAPRLKWSTKAPKVKGAPAQANGAPKSKRSTYGKRSTTWKTEHGEGNEAPRGKGLGLTVLGVKRLLTANGALGRKQST